MTRYPLDIEDIQLNILERQGKIRPIFAVSRPAGKPILSDTVGDNWLNWDE